MKLHLTFIAFLLINLMSFSQNEHEFVKLSEEKKGKRLTLFAVNTDSIPYNVFLRVVTSDYRRSGNRPIIMDVPPNSKIPLITLIQLVGSQGSYVPTFIVNKVARDIEVNKDYSDLKLRLNKAVKSRKAILFVSDDCAICPEIKNVLLENNVGFIEHNMDKETLNYLNTVKELETDKEPIISGLPILKINKHFYKNIKSINDFNKILREAFN